MNISALLFTISDISDVNIRMVVENCLKIYSSVLEMCLRYLNYSSAIMETYPKLDILDRVLERRWDKTEKGRKNGRKVKSNWIH